MNWIFIGALCGALSVIAGAFGAHALAARLEPRELQLFGAQGARRGVDGAGWCLLLGSAIFSGTVFGLALGGPRWLGAITPLGGTLLIVGFLIFAWAALKG
jgi:uncharacterized membrane protein YgdD (TMEM256/DUF423 family)